MYQKLVTEWMNLSGQHVARKPQHVNEKLVVLLMDMLNEETSELTKAMWSGKVSDIAQEIADVLYVTFGIANHHGISMEKVFKLVHESNLTKISDGQVERNHAGKIVKGANYKKPDLAWLDKK